MKLRIIIAIAILSISLPTSNSFAIERVCFSPGPCCRENIKYLIRNAQENIKIAINHFADEEILDCLREAIERDVKIMVITDARMFFRSDSIIYALSYSGAKVKMPASNFEGNRFAIFDNRIIFIGTYNWTYAGEAVYSNNCLVLDDITIVDKYVHRFGFLWEIYEK